MAKMYKKSSCCPRDYVDYFLMVNKHYLKSGDKQEKELYT